MNSEQILSDRTYKEIQKSLSALDRADREIELATGCNIDMQDLKLDVDALRQQLILLKSTYFPGKK